MIQSHVTRKQLENPSATRLQQKWGLGSNPQPFLGHQNPELVAGTMQALGFGSRKGGSVICRLIHTPGQGQKRAVGRGHPIKTFLRVQLNSFWLQLPLTQLWELSSSQPQGWGKRQCSLESASATNGLEPTAGRDTQGESCCCCCGLQGGAALYWESTFLPVALYSPPLSSLVPLFQHCSSRDGNNSSDFTHNVHAFDSDLSLDFPLLL